MKSSKTHAQQIYGPIKGLTMEASAYQMISKRFDFGAESAVCQHLVQMVLATLEDHDRQQGIVRVSPFTLLVRRHGVNVPISLINQSILSQLTSSIPFVQVLRNLREQVFKQILQVDSSWSMDQTRRILAPSELLTGGRSTGTRPTPIQDIESCRVDLAQLRQLLSVSSDLVPPTEQLVEPPASVLAQVGPAIEQEGRSPELAASLVSHLISLRECFCPRLDDLEPGQLMAVTLVDVNDRRMSRKMHLRSHVPVRLTLFDEAELAALERIGPRDREAVEALLSNRIARILTEAYCQGGLMSLTLVGILTHLSPQRVGRLVDRFEAQHQLILPTPGTIHDAGSKLTHKAMVIQKHLSGMDCKEIARETYHTEEAVDRYIDDFERTLIATGHGLPSHLLARVLKLGKHVVAQYEALIEKHIGGMPEVRALLIQKGIDLSNEKVA